MQLQATQQPPLEELVHNLDVGLFVPRLISSNGGADLAQDLVAVLRCMGRGVSVADLGGPLLEAGVDEAQVGVVLCLGVHA